MGGKKQRLTSEQKRRLEELEASLFGGATGSLQNFGKEEEELAARLPSKFGQVGAAAEEEDPSLIIWEDKRPAHLTFDEEEGGSSEEEGSDEASEGTAPDSSEGVADDLQAGIILGNGRDTEDAEAVSVSGSEDEMSDLEERRASGQQAEVSGKRRPVWEDPGDEALEVDIAGINRLRKLRASDEEALISGKEYSQRLKQQHAKLNPRTSWASSEKAKKRRRISDEEDSEGEEALEAVQQGASNLLTGQAILPAGLLETTRLRDANLQEPSKASVLSLEFHPGGQLLFTSGLDKHLRFFQVDGVKNAKVQSIYLEDLPIHKAAFASGGSQVIASGRRKHFYLLDLEASRVERVSHLTNRAEKSLENFAVSSQPGHPLIAFHGARGHIPLVSLQSRQVVGQLKMAGSVRSAAFTDDGLNLIASGGDGVIHTWDMRTRRCVSRFVDEGALRGICLATSPGSRLLASGSDAGFVNVYDQKAAFRAGSSNLGQPTAAAVVPPSKSLTNLVTAVDNLLFSPDGQILAMASKEKKDALRLVHTASLTTFSNWPTSRSPLGRVHSMAFSPHSGFFAVGNDKGKALLYRMHHYAEA